ncbi:hypothetical protein [Streptomyces collinus]|uniref:hypothetical protein n=1 Tax=Streptomyces collinus TaxID=42684 RepID=UPI0036E6356A
MAGDDLGDVAQGHTLDGRPCGAGRPSSPPTPKPQERELIKLASIAAALAAGLRRRAVAEPYAILAAETGVAVFKTAFERWVDDPDPPDFAHVVRDTFDALRAVTSGR